MSFKIVVLAKQVPDTRHVGKDAMKEDGTINRGALPAIFNPDDLNVLEMALEVKSKIKNATVHVLTMGPNRASSIIKEAMYRGADGGSLLTDARFAGSDTLATSYALYKAVEKMQPNLIFCGVQAIDGDTAQVGPQVAEKMKFPQITYAEELLEANEEKICVLRRLEHGTETVESKFPLLVTVYSSAKPCRTRNAKLFMKYKYAATPSELSNIPSQYAQRHQQMPELAINEWNVESIAADVDCLGLKGSPTKVKCIDNIVLTQKEAKSFSDSDADVEQLVVELLESRVIG